MRKLSIGCGENWKEEHPDYEGIDVNDYGQKYVGDALQQAISLNGKYYGIIIANHILEHFDFEYIRMLMNELYDLLEDDGELRIIVPHKSKGKAWVPCHSTHWCEETFKFFARKNVALYGYKRWKIKEVTVNYRNDIYCVMKRYEKD